MITCSQSNIEVVDFIDFCRLKLDAAIDYKSTKDMAAALKEACPKVT